MPPKPKRLGPKRSSGGASADSTGAGAAAAADRAKVCLRIRPALSEEEGGLQNLALQCDHEQQMAWAMGDGGVTGEDSVPRQFVFDHLLEQHGSQSELFDLIGAPMVSTALNGGVGCILCFGASGAGKECSMRCERPGQEGLLPRTLAALLPGSSSAAAATPRRLPMPGEAAGIGPQAVPVRLAYLLLTPEMRLRDLLRGEHIDASEARRGRRPRARC